MFYTFPKAGNWQWASNAVYRSMLSTYFGSDNTHLLSTAEQYGHQLVCVEAALFAVPIEERFRVIIVCCAAGWNPSCLHDNLAHYPLI